MSEHGLDELERKIVDDVATHGCFIMSVFDPEGVEPDFSYSIGFQETLDQPEVMVFSLSKALRVSMINEIWRQASAEGLVLKDGLEIRDLLEGFVCVAKEVTERDAIVEHLGSAIWYNERHKGAVLDRAFQIVWPGAKQGLFPWEQGCDQSVIDDQPALYHSGLH